MSKTENQIKDGEGSDASTCSEVNAGHHDHFIKSVLHRCVDLGWREAQMCQRAGISKGMWSQIRNRKKSPTIKTMVKILNAVGLQVKFRLHENEKHTAQYTSLETRENDDQGFNAGC